MWYEGGPSRLRGHDYSFPGYYFVTTVVQENLSLFGEIVDGVMKLNAAGEMVSETWEDLPSQYPNIEVDVSQIMPDHFHGIIQITKSVGRKQDSPDMGTECNHSALISDQYPGCTGWADGLGDVMYQFKSLTTSKYRHGVRDEGWMSFAGKLWMTNYHDRVIRHEGELRNVRKYIQNNPMNWTKQ